MSLSDQWSPTTVQVTVLQARGLRIKGKSGTNDAYAVMQLGKEKYQTSVAEKSVAPVWKEEASFDMPSAHQGGTERGALHVLVLHRALVGPDKLLGQAVVHLLQLSEDRDRDKTQWFKLLDKSGKPDKDRGELLVDIQFTRNNMTASMFDISAAGKSRSRLGKFKDKVRGKKKEDGLSETSSNLVPALSQVMTDSEGEGDNDGEEAAAGTERKKKGKVKSLFSHKTNLQKNLSQSMSVLPGKNSSLSGSVSSGLNVEASEGKKKFKFLSHKRTASSDKKEQKLAAEQSNLCINGSHIYCEESAPRTSRASSNFSLASSGVGSMEDVPDSSPPSAGSRRSVRHSSPWTEEDEEETIEESTQQVDQEMLRRQELEKFAEEDRRMKEEQREREEEEHRLDEEKRRQEKIRIEQERLQKEEEEKRAVEMMRAEEERRRTEEEQKRRELEEKEHVRKEEERIRLELERKRREEEEEKQRQAEEEIRLEAERKAEEKRRQEEREELRKLEEERVRKERLVEEERKRREEEKRKEEELRIEKEQEEKRRMEKERKREEEEEERKRLQEEKIRLEREMERQREEEELLRKEREEQRRQEEEKKQQALQQEQERIRLEEAEKMRLEEEMRKCKKEEEYERLRAEQKKLEELEERQKREEALEEERLAKEEMRREEEKRRREDEERLAAEEAQTHSKSASETDRTSTNPFDESDEDNFHEANVPGSQGSVTSARQRCKLPVERNASTSGDVGTTREKRPAPKPPRMNSSGTRQAAQHEARVNQQSKDKEIKTASVLPQCTAQKTHVSTSSSHIKNNQSEHFPRAARSSGRGPAPQRPSLKEEKHLSLKDPLVKSKQAPSVSNSNPFEDDEDVDELADTTVPASVMRQYPVQQSLEKETVSSIKVKSSKTAHAPAPPAITTSVSSTDTSHEMMISDISENKDCAPVQETSPRESCAGQEEAVKDAPPVPSRRLQPVRPLNPQDQKPIASIQDGRDKKFTGEIDSLRKEKVKDAGPYALLTQEELISLVLKQESQLVEKSKKISELEQYIDNLLVRVIEEAPSVLMTMTPLK